MYIKGFTFRYPTNSRRMLNQVNKNDTLTRASLHRRQRECELCEEVKLCTEHYEIVACQDCGSTYLPRRAVL